MEEEEEKKTYEPRNDRNKKNAKLWKARIVFYDMGHMEVGSIIEKGEEIEGSTNIIDYITPRIEKKMREEFWRSFILWAGHERVSIDMTFDDVNYMRKEDGSIIFLAEDGDCNNDFHNIPIMAKVFKTKKCVVCEETIPTRILRCLHICLCDKCYETTERCPICEKRKIKKKYAIVPIKK